MFLTLRSTLKRCSIHLLRRLPLAAAVLGRMLPCVRPAGLAARLYVWLAQARADAGDRESAIRYCDLALGRLPSLASAYLCRGRLLAAGGDWRRGAEDLRRALPLLHRSAGQSPSARVRESLATCHETLGQWLAEAGRPEEALAHFNAAVAASPERGPLYIWRGECLHTLGRTEAAADDYRTALASDLDSGHLRLLYGAKGRLLAREGFVGTAVANYYAQQALSPPVEAASDHALLVQAYDHLAEDVVNRYGDLAAARRTYRAKLKFQEDLFRSFSIDPSETLILPDDWVRNIGHMGAIDSVLKLNQLGWRSWRRIVLLAPREGTANRHYLSYFDSQLTTITDASLCKALAPLATTFGFRVAHGLYPPGSDLLYSFEALGLIQQEWEAQGRGPLLTLTDSDKERGRKALGAMGVPRDAWFVSLHVRESGFHEAGGSRHQAHRNADPLDYLPAIREITARGGWVVRLGDPSMTPLPPMERVVDYAHAPAKADWMDVFLCGDCRFFVGLASGLSQVAVSFGVPCVYVNWISNVLPPFSAKDVFIPKLFHGKAEGRLLSFEEMFDPENLYKNANYYLIGGDDRRFRDSDPSDIRECVGEILDQLDGRCVYTPEDLRLRERLDAVMRRFGHRGYSRMGKAFLHKYSRLLNGRAESVAPRAAG